MKSGFCRRSLRSLTSLSILHLFSVHLYVTTFALAHVIQHELDDDLGLESALSISPNSRCSHVLIRQEWRTLTDEQKAEYIKAVKCTQSLANVTSYAGVERHFDDFQAVHIHTADSIHYVGHFLPWHRRFVKIYETTLREQCGYRGAIPYWDWSQDVHPDRTILESPVFDPNTGFGGDGVPGTFNLSFSQSTIASSQIYLPSFVGCVLDGPFSPLPPHSYQVNLGPGKTITPHCLMRGIDNDFTELLSKEAVDKALSMESFEKFRVELEGGEDRPAEHGAGHLVIGGDLGNLYSSPADPLFFLHHANLDRLWWTWQSQNLTYRLTDVSGKIHPFEPPVPHTNPDIPDSDSSSQPSGTSGPHTNHTRMKITTALKDKNSVALDFMLHYGNHGAGKIAESIAIKEIMDIREWPLCYVYR